MPPIARVNATIQTDSGPISVAELSSYLRHLRATYVLSLRAARALGTAEVSGSDSYHRIAMELEDYRFPLRGPQLANLARAKLDPGVDLVFLDISRSNPLLIVFECVGVALAAAAILSGGKVKVTLTGFGRCV
jgi:hypothetical protein